MATRPLVSTGVLAILIAALPVAAQTKPYTPPRTVDGQPDLQGYWTNSTYTPLESPIHWRMFSEGCDFPSRGIMRTS